MSVVLFLSGSTMGDALGASGRGLRHAFEELGREFVEVNLAEPTAAELLNRTLTNKEIELVFSHVGIGIDLLGETSDKRKVNLWTGRSIPFVTFFGDSPAYFFDRHVMPGPGFACLYAFPEHYELRKTLPRRLGMLGITPLRVSDDTSRRDLDFRAKERGRLVFLKNGNDPLLLIRMWRDSLPSDVFVMLTELASDLAGKIQSDEGTDIDVAVRSFFLSKNLDVDDLPALRLFFVAQLDDYLRRVKSTLMAEVLRDFPIDIHGYNWEHVDFKGRRARYVYGADYTASKQLIKDSLGIIDMSPNTTLGPHDRPLRAFGLYTLCITNEQKFFAKNFTQHRDFTFRFDRDSLEHRVTEVLSNPKRFVELGIEVAEAFRRQFDSALFGRTILEVASYLRLAVGPRPAGLQEFFVWPPSKLAQQWDPNHG